MGVECRLGVSVPEVGRLELGGGLEIIVGRGKTGIRVLRWC